MALGTRMLRHKKKMPRASALRSEKLRVHRVPQLNVNDEIEICHARQKLN